MANAIEQSEVYLDHVGRLKTLEREKPSGSSDPIGAKAAEKKRIQEFVARSVSNIADHYRAAIRIFPDYGPAHNNLGVLLMDQLNRPAEASRHFERVAEIDPESVEAWFTLAHSHRVAGNDEEARKALRRTIELDNTFELAHRASIYLELSSARYQETVLAMKRFSAFGGADIRENVLDDLMRIRQFDQALALADAIVKDDPEYFPALATRLRLRAQLGHIFHIVEPIAAEPLHRFFHF